MTTYPMELDAVYIDTYSSYLPLFIPGSDEYAAFDMELQRDIRAAGVFTFSITSRHPLYAEIIPRKTEVTVMRGGAAHWSGYINRIIISTPGIKTCECIGVLDYLNDSVQLPADLGNTEADRALMFLLDQHNEQMAGCSHKCITPGSTSYSGRVIKNFVIERPTSTLEVIKEYFGFGVYQLVRSPVDLTLNHIDGSELAAVDQSVVYGENLISLKEEINCNGMITRLIPLGKDGDNYVTVSGVNGGIPYIDAATAGMHTPVVDSVVFDDISDPTKLLAAGREYLANQIIRPTRTLTAEAFDKYILGAASAPLPLGGIIRLHAEPHGITNEKIECTSVIEEIGRPYDSRFKFGNK